MISEIQNTITIALQNSP
ncbi:unnamed protein product, partial [Rotaria sp. Silwood1]